MHTNTQQSRWEDAGQFRAHDAVIRVSGGPKGPVSSWTESYLYITVKAVGSRIWPKGDFGFTPGGLLGPK